MQRYHLHTQHGFSLIELLIALVVLSIALLGLSQMTASMLTVHTENERSAHAAALLQDCMEKLKYSGYQGADAVWANTLCPTQDYGQIAQYSTYKRVTTVALNTPAADMKTVTVTIYWQNGLHTLSTSTILAKQ